MYKRIPLKKYRDKKPRGDRDREREDKSKDRAIVKWAANRGKRDKRKEERRGEEKEKPKETKLMQSNLKTGKSNRRWKRMVAMREERKAITTTRTQ